MASLLLDSNVIGLDGIAPSPSAKISILSIAAMHTPLPRWVKTRIYRIATLTPASPQ
jgi:hypothetical protein